MSVPESGRFGYPPAAEQFWVRQAEVATELSGDLALERARKALDVFETAHDHLRSNNALFEFGKAQVLLERYEEGLNTLDQVLTVATDEDPKDFEFIVDIETSMAAVMRILGRNADADEIDRRLISVREALADEVEGEVSGS